MQFRFDFRGVEQLGVSLEAAAHVDTGSARSTQGLQEVTVTLFVVTSLLGTGLAYGAVPVLVRMLLAGYGGSPMVWSISVVFLQIAILAGCLLAHWSQRITAPGPRFLAQLTLLVSPVFVLPFAAPAWSAVSGSRPAALSLLLVLTIVAGAPVAALSMTGPLLLRWYSGTQLPHARNPYLLFAVGNAGGVLMLVAYPFLIEPKAGQSRWWLVGYGLFAACAVACRLIVRYSPAGSAQETPVEQTSWRRRTRWAALTSVPAALMLAVTAHLATELYTASIVWMVPLVVYLASFVIAFGLPERMPQVLGPIVTVAALSAVPLPWALHLMGYHLHTAGTLLSLAGLFVGGLACHGLLAEDRPGPAGLTEFFLFSSLGAALGGTLAALVAPMVFNWVAELPIALTALAFLSLLHNPGPEPEVDERWRFPGGTALIKAFVLAGPLLATVVYLRLGVLALVLAAGVMLLPWCVLAERHHRTTAMAAVLATVALFWYQIPGGSFRERTFFASYRIFSDNGWRVLADGPIIRGYQYEHGPGQHLLGSYYGRTGPFGDLYTAYGNPSKRVAVVGVGTGVVAGYGHKGQELDFFDEDPAAVAIATHRFDYLRKSQATVSVVTGDGRSKLAQRPDGSYGMILLDAFASAASPFHLLTKQALQTYVRKLSPGGVLVFHVSNGVQLTPIIQATALSDHLAVTTGYGVPDANRIQQASFWVVATRRAADFKPLAGNPRRWRRWPVIGRVWSDSSPVLFDTGKGS